MDVRSMLANGAQDTLYAADDRKHQQHAYSTRHAASTPDQHFLMKAPSSTAQRISSRTSDTTAATAGASRYPKGSPAKKDQKHVVFQLIDTEDPRIQARLPMRVMISAHDNTDSIIATVKNFYGLYEYGVSFENKDGIGIIAAYDNFRNDMTVYVRTVPQPVSNDTDTVRNSLSPKKPTLGAPFEARPSHHNNAYSPSRSAARSARARSMSPHSDLGRRSLSAAPGAKMRAPKIKSREDGAPGDADGYSSDDGANASVTSSRRSKTEQVNAEISVDNIVEGGRRKRAFESSELPLFVPPQMPISGSISSISPQRRSGPGNAASPHVYSNQHTFSYPHPLPSPHTIGHGMQYAQPSAANGGQNGAYYAPPRQLRGHPSVSSLPSVNRLSTGGVLPTPDPTVGSAISDEDVALQLMRLGDASNFSYGRTSTSTLDDAFSGKAEPPYSDEDDEEDERDDTNLPGVPEWPQNDAGPQRKKQRMMKKEPPSDASSAEEYDDRHDASFKGDSDELIVDGQLQARGSKTKPAKARPSMMPKPKSKALAQPVKPPMSPTSLATHSRKASVASSVNFNPHFGPDEEDLSSKPRCQRCRKSKKGCDRQRPCGRCKDAGIGIEGCVSEDEGNGRKGRFGRHMGVPVAKAEEVFGPVDTLMAQPAIPTGGYFLAPAPVDKSKKRKR